MRASPVLRMVLLVTLLVGGCMGGTVATPASSGPATASTEPGETLPPGDEPSEAPSEEPLPTDEPVATATPQDEPSPAGSADPGPAAACSGSDENRDFYRAAAAALDWTVYCAVLPKGWFVGSGQYRQAGGGWVEIAYRGPSGARLELHEGAFCSAGDGCVPAGTDAGDAAFGDKAGTFVALDDGGWAVVVDRGEPISWLAVGTGLDEAAFRDIASDLAAVGD
jgi:hypothetical protein